MAPIRDSRDWSHLLSSRGAMVELSAGSSLLGRPSSRGGRRSVLALLCAAAVVGAVCVLAQQGRVGRSVLGSRQNFLMAKRMLDSGKDLQAAGQRDIQMAKILLNPYDGARSRSPRFRPFSGHLLAENATNATEPEVDENEEGQSPLEIAGVKVNGWAGSAEVQYLPGTIKYLSDQKMADEKQVRLHLAENTSTSLSMRCGAAGVHASGYCNASDATPLPPHPRPCTPHANPSTLGSRM